ncbi:MAG TPA: flagellar hook-basal body complex protein FliE [Nocardioidaceae bacterium]|nr:flagellar hook-basal body complex protein FliE [Nocardioidaceae bacterium]
MSVPAIEPGGFMPYLPPTVAPTRTEGADAVAGSTGAAGVAGPSGPSFADALSGGLERLQSVHDRADGLAVQAATGNLSNLHDYTIAATEAAVTTQLTTAVRNKALEAFTEIMRMSI